jgi:uncharacterized membrane protein YgcG
LAGLAGFGQPSLIYPKSGGAVSDYAGRLNKDQVKELTGIIQQYQRETSIEFVVVAVENLQGQSAKEYALGLGDAWGVGKAEHNGIVLLWAPNERAYSLRVGDGLNADINDAEAAQITQQSLLPNFKSRHYYAGLKETVLATMSRLGHKTWHERLEARALVAEQEREAEARYRQAQAEQEAERVRVLVIGILILAGGGIGGIAIYRWMRRRAKLSELAQAGPAIAGNIAKAEANAPQIARLLEDFSKEAPEQDISALRAEPAGQRERIVKLKLDATLLDFSDVKSFDEMVRIKRAAEAEADLLDETREKIGKIRAAKTQSQALMDQLSKETFAISDVRDTSRRNEVDQLLLRSREDFDLARQNSSMSMVDWLVINEMLNRSQNQVRQAVTYSQEEPYVASPGYDDSSNAASGGLFSSGSGSTSFDNSSSTSSSSDSGGAGFSGGSGSDGTY